MKDLTIIFTGALGLILVSYGVWLIVVLLLTFLNLMFKGFMGLVRINAQIMRENPYIVAHRKLLLDQQQYEEYKAIARKDGIIIQDREED